MCVCVCACLWASLKVPEMVAPWGNDTCMANIQSDPKLSLHWRPTDSTPSTRFGFPTKLRLAVQKKKISRCSPPPERAEVRRCEHVPVTVACRNDDNSDCRTVQLMEAGLLYQKLTMHTTEHMILWYVSPLALHLSVPFISISGG